MHAFTRAYENGIYDINIIWNQILTSGHYEVLDDLNNCSSLVYEPLVHNLGLLACKAISDKQAELLNLLQPC